MAVPAEHRSLRVGFVPGVTPDKWSRIWRERHPRDPLELRLVEQPDPVRVLHDGEVDLCLVRLPVEPDGLHLVSLYVERPVVLVPSDHPLTAYDEVAVAELADENVVTGVDLAGAVAQVASGAGVLVVPHSLARLHRRRDVEHRFVTGLEGTTVGLAWRRDRDDQRLQTFVGIVRGRTARSSRGAGPGRRPPTVR